MRLRIQTPKLRYEKNEDSFVDKDEDVLICREDGKPLFGMRRSKKYRLLIYTYQPKKKAKKFEFLADTREFLHDDEFYEVADETLDWLAQMLGIEDLFLVDHKEIWVRVKEV